MPGKRIHLLVFFSLLIFLFTTGCNSDLLGLFRSTDLDERLKEQNNFKFLRHEDRNISVGEEYSFIVVSDTHIENGNTFGLEKLKDVIAADSSIKFAVITGDITQNGSRKDIETFITLARSLGIPCYPVIGNHDIYFDNWTHWKNLIGSTRYRINGDGTTLFMLDSANLFFGKEQLDWLEREIKKTQGRVFVFTHVNLFSISPVIIQQLPDVRERARLISILSGRCDIMFMGHNHHGSTRETGGVIFLTAESFIDNKIYYLVSVTKTGISYKQQHF